MRFRMIVAVLLTCAICGGSCSNDARRANSARGALRIAWHAYRVQAPEDSAAVSGVRYKAAMDESIARLDSAAASIPPGGGREYRWLASAVAGFAVILRDRRDAHVTIWKTTRENGAGLPSQEIADPEARYRAEEQEFMELLRAGSSKDYAAEAQVVALAAWERRYLREHFLEDAYVGDVLGQVALTRAGGEPDSNLLHRPEVESRVDRADSVMVGEIDRIK